MRVRGVVFTCIEKLVSVLILVFFKGEVRNRLVSMLRSYIRVVRMVGYKDGERALVKFIELEKDVYALQVSELIKSLGGGDLK